MYEVKFRPVSVRLLLRLREIKRDVAFEEKRERTFSWRCATWRTHHGQSAGGSSKKSAGMGKSGSFLYFGHTEYQQLLLLTNVDYFPRAWARARDSRSH